MCNGVDISAYNINKYFSLHCVTEWISLELNVYITIRFLFFQN